MDVLEELDDLDVFPNLFKEDIDFQEIMFEILLKWSDQSSILTTTTEGPLALPSK